MSPPQDTPGTKTPETDLRWPMLLVTGLVAIGVAFLVTPNNLASIKMLERHRATITSNASNPLYREAHFVIAYYRSLDRQLAPGARIFFSGMTGPESVPRLHYYFFARTYLFPHEVEISLDQKAVYHTSWFEGVDATSPDELRTNGFDLMLKVGSDGKVVPMPLTEKGALRQ